MQIPLHFYQPRSLDAARIAPTSRVDGEVGSNLFRSVDAKPRALEQTGPGVCFTSSRYE